LLSFMLLIVFLLSSIRVICRLFNLFVELLHEGKILSSGVSEMCCPRFRDLRISIS
jgi:hypothetical protein